MYPQQDPSARNKKRLIVVAIGVFLSIIAIIAISISGAKGSNQQAAKNLKSFSDDAFSVSYPQEFSVAPTQSGQTFTGPKDKDGNQEQFTVTRYARISDSINLSTLESLTVKKNNGAKISGAKTSSTKISNRDALDATLDGTTRVVYIASSSYIWSIRFSYAKESGTLTDQATNILNSFTPKEDAEE